MLQIIRVPDRVALRSLIAGFDPQDATWVVSDLRSKFEIQQGLLERQSGFLDTSVLRASDLWKNLLRRLVPEVRVVSRDFAKSIVRHFLNTHSDLLNVNGISENFLLSLMDRFSGIVFHPEGDRLMKEWFSQNDEAMSRWGMRYQVAQSALRYLESQNLVTAKWIAGALQMVPEGRLRWDRPLIVDLGAELTSAEAVLFQRLSQTVDVTLLEPHPDGVKATEFLLRPYRDLEGYAKQVVKAKATDSPTPHRRVLRFSSQLAEVKEAVVQARLWLEQGVVPRQISILAPEIEAYWPVLKPYMEEEGLATDKAVAVKLNSLPSVSRWLARLRPRRGDLTPADLELAYYAFEDESPIRHEEFRSLFANLYGEEDLDRHAAVKRFFERKIAGGSGVMSRDVFLEISSRFWDGIEGSEAFLIIAREVLQNAMGGTELAFAEWIRYVEAISASKEMTVTLGEPAGIFVGNFSSAHASGATHRIFLGLSEEGMRKAERNPLPIKDIREISKLGFHLDHPDQSLLEFEFKWLFDFPADHDVLMVGMSSFDGTPRSPSALWLSYAEEQNKSNGIPDSLDLPASPRWDVLQSQKPEVWQQERGWTPERGGMMNRRIRQDLGEENPDRWSTKGPTKFSPSAIKTYLDCPFRLASSALFRLRDLTELDLDMTRTDAGSLTHALFQTLTDDGWVKRAAVSDSEILELIESLRKKLNFVFPDDRLWEPFLKKQIRVVREFLRVEREWKEKFPQMEILQSEMEWKIFFDPQTGHFSHDQGEGSLELRGRIDRLERDHRNRYVVIDYKASQASLNHHTAWLSENELQLLFYMWAIEKGALPDYQGDVIGAFYYVYRNFSREIGFQLEDEAGVLFPSAGRKKNLKATRSDKAELYGALEARIRDVVSKTTEGDWGPRPRAGVEQTLCERCSWNGLCRSAHLN